MKKIFSVILLLCLALTFAACADQGSTQPEDTTAENAATESTTAESTTAESTTPEITLEEVYNAGKDYAALLGNHESVYLHATINGAGMYEVYLSKQYYYTHYSAEYMDMGFAYSSFITDHTEYICFESVYERNVTLTPDGMLDMSDALTPVGENGFIMAELLTDETVTIVEEDGSIIVTSNADPDEIYVDEGVVSCVEIYVLDAKTREMTSVKTVYTYEDGTVEEGVVTITRDGEVPEGVKPFLVYEQETENMRTITIVSNPGAENEKTESVQAPKGLQVSLSPHWTVEEAMSLYTDAACTRIFEVDADTNADLTVYVKWGE